MRKMIEEFYYRSGGKTPTKLLCGRGLFLKLCDEGKIKYNMHYADPMTATFYGIPIMSVDNPNLIEDDKIIILGDNNRAETYRTDYQTNYYQTDYCPWNRPAYDGYYKYYRPAFQVPFQTKYAGTPMRNADEEISISEDEFLQVLNGGG